MRGRSGLVAGAGVAALALAACGGGRAPVFHPAGRIPRQSAVTLTLPAQNAPGGFRFPAGVSIQFTTPLPAGSPDRAIVAGYRAYVLALWAAVLSHGQDTAFQHLAGGNARAFVLRETRYYAARGQTVRGTIRYFDTTVTAVYFGRGANVTSCVDASGFRGVNTRTGATTGPVFPHRYARYLEDVAEARAPDGAWPVRHTEAFPASTAEGASCR
jgi:hypothetical protein